MVNGNESDQSIAAYFVADVYEQYNEHSRLMILMRLQINEYEKHLVF